MLAIILVPLWYGYLASRRGRNAVGWGFLGIAIFVVLKVIVTLISINSNVSSHDEAISLTIFLNILLFGGTFFIAFLIPRKEEQNIKCPNCARINANDTWHCDCGYDFHSKEGTTT